MSLGFEFEFRMGRELPLAGAAAAISLASYLLKSSQLSLKVRVCTDELETLAQRSAIHPVLIRSSGDDSSRAHRDTMRGYNTDAQIADASHLARPCKTFSPELPALQRHFHVEDCANVVPMHKS